MRLFQTRNSLLTKPLTVMHFPHMPVQTDAGTVSSPLVQSFLGRPHNCILFNDESHTMEEVVLQIIRAISCTAQRAVDIMLEAHNNGRAIVITAHKERCEQVSSVLEEIRLETKIEPA